MLTSDQIKGSMRDLILHDDGSIQTADMLELLNEILSWREAYPDVKLRRQRWDFVLKQFVDVN